MSCCYFLSPARTGRNDPYRIEPLKKETSKLLDVTHVTPKPDFSLLLTFENGEFRRFDMSPYLGQKPWVRLKMNGTFLSARVGNGTVVWPGNIDIDPETLYELSVPVDSMPA